MQFDSEINELQCYTFILFIQQLTTLHRLKTSHQFLLVHPVLYRFHKMKQKQQIW